MIVRPSVMEWCVGIRMTDSDTALSGMEYEKRERPGICQTRAAPL